MDLQTYLKTAGHGAGVALARAVGVHPVMVSQWASGVKPVPVERCVSIETATERLVMRWDLRPEDWRQHWPELVEAVGAPPKAPDLIVREDGELTPDQRADDHLASKIPPQLGKRAEDRIRLQQMRDRGEA